MLRNALAYMGVLLVGLVVAGAAFWGLAKFIDPATTVGGGRQLLVWPLVIAAGVSYPLLQVSFNSRGRLWVFLVGVVLAVLEIGQRPEVKEEVGLEALDLPAVQGDVTNIAV